MSCRGKGYGKDVKTDEYLYSQFTYAYANAGVKDISQMLILPAASTQRNRISNCRAIINKGYPNFTPYIGSLSISTSASGVYSNVTIAGYNFLPNQMSFVKFGSFDKVPVLFLSPIYISFIIPSAALAGTYSVQVVNIYNNDFSPCINMRYPGSYVYSNAVTYTIT